MELREVSDWMGVVGEGGRIVAGISLGQQGWSIFGHRIKEETDLGMKD